MGSKPWMIPAPTYLPLDASWDSDADAPGPRCTHTLTAVAPTKSHGPRLILFGGTTAIEGGASGSGIRLAGVTNSIHCFDVLTKKWTSIQPVGDPPSPRAAHAAAAVGTMVAFQEQNNLAGLSGSCNFVKADFMKMPFSDNTFDAIYAIEATCHAPDVLTCYKEILRVLKPGNCFAAYEWCMTEHYDPDNESHRQTKAEIELGIGLLDVRLTSQCLEALNLQGSRLYGRRILR